MSSKGFVNKAKSGARALPSRWRQAVAKARLDRDASPPPRKPKKRPSADPPEARR